MFFSVGFVNEERSVSQQQQVLVQFCPTLPLVGDQPGSTVKPQDHSGVSGGAEGPGEGEVLDTVWSHARDGEGVAFFLCDVF